MTTTATRMNTKLRACAAQRLSCQHIVLTNGPSLTLKTTLARYLGHQLRIRVGATYQYGTVLTDEALDEEKRLGRYGPLFVAARGVLASGHSVMLDGNFGDYTRRERLWELATEFEARVIAIRTSCDDLELIHARARRRAADPAAPDHGVGVEAFLLTRDEVLAHPLENDPEFRELGVEVVEFRTGTEAYAGCAPETGADARMITAILRGSGLLGSSPACVARGQSCTG
ncbi:MAG: hypothetical protein ABIG44_17595 [Planctomycetota bacterium]